MMMRKKIRKIQKIPEIIDTLCRVYPRPLLLTTLSVQ